MDARHSKEAVSMKKQTLIKTFLAIAAGILMILISFTGFQTILPTGEAFMPLAGVIAVGIAVALGINIAFIVTLVSAIIMIVLGTADWVILVDFIVILIVVGLILRKQVPLSIDLNHSQLLWLAIFTGLVQLFFISIFYGLIGLVLTGTPTGGLTFVQLIIPNALLTGLLYGFLVAPISLICRWVARKTLHIDNNHHNDSGNSAGDKQGGSIIVDLRSAKNKKDDKYAKCHGKNIRVSSMAFTISINNLHLCVPFGMKFIKKVEHYLLTVICNFLGSFSVHHVLEV